MDIPQEGSRMVTSILNHYITFYENNGHIHTKSLHNLLYENNGHIHIKSLNNLFYKNYCHIHTKSLHNLLYENNGHIHIKSLNNLFYKNNCHIHTKSLHNLLFKKQWVDARAIGRRNPTQGSRGSGLLFNAVLTVRCASEIPLT